MSESESTAMKAGSMVAVLAFGGTVAARTWFFFSFFTPLIGEDGDEVPVFTDAIEATTGTFGCVGAACIPGNAIVP